MRYTTECVAPELVGGTVESSVHMAVSEDSEFAEVWSAGAVAERDERDGIAWAHDGEYLFCAGLIPPGPSYAEGTRAAYVNALDLMETLGFTNCFRMWNFVNRINEDNADGLEVYRDFCRGRAEAFERFRFREAQLPAATGIGALGGGIAFYFLASRSAVLTSVENSKQIPPYHYPPRYGPRPPKFSRATCLSRVGADSAAEQIYVSGTASIRGHETLFPDDIERQCALALDNIAHVIGEENLSAYGVREGRALTDLRNVKVYVRNPEDIPVVRDMCARAFSPEADVAFLNVDICRSDLLVEIESVVD
ncbi:hypothetical protein HCC61_28955 [Streptomyces sp. HNM0575]|nr:hypothetical protein [Streptomyces sp. HNM0575]